MLISKRTASTFIAVAIILAVEAVVCRRVVAQRAAAPAATLSNIRGSVHITSIGDKAARPAPAGGGGIRAGDVINVGGSAELSLTATRIRYQLLSGSRVRITDDGKTLRSISGPFPRRLTGAGLGDIALTSAEQQRRMSVLAPFLDGRLQATVTRGDEKSLFAPSGITPEWGVAATSREPIRVRWSAQNDPSAGSYAYFRLTITDSMTKRILFRTRCPASSRDTVIPAATLTPGVWYIVSVALVDDDAPVALEPQTAVCLRLLTDKERDWLQKKLAEAPADPSHADLRRARAYETVGMTTEAPAAYESAMKKKGGLDAETVTDVRKSIEFLRNPQAAMEAAQ